MALSLGASKSPSGPRGPGRSPIRLQSGTGRAVPPGPTRSRLNCQWGWGASTPIELPTLLGVPVAEVWGVHVETDAGDDDSDSEDSEFGPW